MPLTSFLFRDDKQLQTCLINDAAHVRLGAKGEHVEKIQAAIIFLDGLRIDEKELTAKFYGQATAAAVLAYKQKRNIINWTYQSQPDNIVGKMTIASLDQELVEHQEPSQNRIRPVCTRPEGS